MARCFLGFELTDASRAYLRERLEPLQRRLAGEAYWPVRGVPADNWHATLLFFPELSAEERAEVWAAVERDAAAGSWRGLGFAWQGLALWPSPRRPGLVCLEAAPYPEAARWPLAGRLDQPPFAKGDTRHLSSYVPHITVMRFRRGRGGKLPRPRDWAAVQDWLPEFDPEQVRFDRLSFFMSTVSPEQPIYPRERTLALQG